MDHSTQQSESDYLDEELKSELEELKHQAKSNAKNPCSGTRYALEMAIQSCQLLGASNDLITKTIEEST